MTERARKLDASRLRVISGGTPSPAPSYRLLTQVSAALSTSLDLDQTLTEILERMNALIAFDAATIFLLDDSRTELHVKAALGVPVSLKEVKSFKVGEGVVGWVVRHGSTALIPDSLKDSRYKPTGAEARPKTVLAAPLRAKDALLGAMVLVRAAKEPFGPEHQRLVEAIASQAAVAIDHARLFEVERQSRRRAEALLATAQACSEAVALPELLQTAVKEVAFTMRASIAAIVKPAEEQLAIEAAFDGGSSTSPGLKTLVGRPLTEVMAAFGGEELTAPTLVRRQDAPLPTDEWWPGSDCQVVAAVPVRWQESVVALLLIGFDDPQRLQPAELDLLDEIGRQVALGMERLRLQSQVQEQQNEIAIVAERNRIARDMHDGLVQYVYSLGLSLEHARDLLASEPASVAAVLTSAIEQLNHVLSEMRTFIYQLRPIIMKEKEIGQWVVDLCQQFQQATGVVVRAEVGEQTVKELSPEISIALFRIIQEALANIYKHARARTATLSLDFAAEAVRLSITDDGEGFSLGERPRPAIEHGHGLANIEERANELGGRVRLESAPGEGHPTNCGVSLQPMSDRTVRLLIADDHEMIRLGLRSILESDQRIRVVGEAGSPQDAVYQAALLRPDVVLLDVRMPGGSGIDACREILGRNLGSRVIMLTSFADEDAVYESIMAGASGYLLKEINKAALIEAVISVSEGRSLLDPEVTRKVLERIRKMAASTDEVVKAALSEQEKRVLRLAAQGKTNKQIAADLFLSDKTVKHHISNILGKLNLSSRAQAAVWATQHGLLDEFPERKAS